MHIRDLILSPPVSLTTAALAIAGFAVAIHQVKKRLGEKTTVLMGMMAAFVFAAQMVNFPILVVPASGHLIGAVLAAVFLGPWAASVVLGVVLLVQCLIFADGGLTAMGANYFNLGLIAVLGGWVIYSPIRHVIGGRTGILVGAMAAAWFSVPLSAIAFSVELAASGRWADFPRILGWMSLVHAGIGLGEAMITGMVVRFILLVRPDLIAESDDEPAPGSRVVGIALGGLAVSFAIAAFLSPFASGLDDGLEFVGGKLGFIVAEGPPTLPAPIAGYVLPGVPGEGFATAAAGLIGTLIVFLAGWLMARAFIPRAAPAIAKAEAHAAGA